MTTTTQPGTVAHYTERLKRREAAYVECVRTGRDSTTADMFREDAREALAAAMRAEGAGEDEVTAALTAARDKAWEVLL